MFFELGFEVSCEFCGVADFNGFVAESGEAIDQVLFEFLFRLTHGGGDEGISFLWSEII